jgi:hypothetical protein
MKKETLKKAEELHEKINDILNELDVWENGKRNQTKYKKCN